MLRLLFALSTIVFFPACNLPGPSNLTGLELSFSKQAVDGPCPETIPDTDTPPPILDRLDIKLYNTEGKIHYSTQINIANGNIGAVSGIPPGYDLTLKVIGYLDGTPSYRGASRKIDINDGKRSQAQVFLTKPGETSCAARPMQSERAFMASAITAPGQIIMAGGFSDILPDVCGPGCNEMVATAESEIFDPDTGTIFPATRLNTPRALATATSLANGRVLVVGGVSTIQSSTDSGFFWHIEESDLIDTFEVYLPDEQIWIEKPLPRGLVFHRATMLTDGKVLITGGGSSWDNTSNTAYIFDPDGESVGSVSILGAATIAPRLGHAAVPLDNGQVLLVGGNTDPSFATLEIFTPSQDGGQFAAKPSIGQDVNLFFHDALVIPLRPDEILVAGGSYRNLNGVLIPPVTNNAFVLSHISTDVVEITSASSMVVPRLMLTMVPLDNTGILLSGGFTDLALTPSDSIEQFDPITNSFYLPSGSAVISVARGGHSVVALIGERALLAGGIGPDRLQKTAELFTSDVGN